MQEKHFLNGCNDFQVIVIDSIHKLTSETFGVLSCNSIYKNEFLVKVIRNIRILTK